MSYILDALKKSDQERRREQGPTLASVHGGWQPPVRSWRAVAIPISITALVLAGVLVWRWYPAVPAAGLAPAVENRDFSESSATVVREPAPAPAPRIAVADPVQTVTPPQPLPAAPPQPPPVQDLWELPDPLRARFPALTFSFHVYADTPSRRAIIINGRRYSEGDTVSADLLLEQITPEGVILQFGGHRVRIPIVADW